MFNFLKRDTGKYGESTILFGKDETSERRAWRNRMIDELINDFKSTADNSLLELKIVVGEFNIGAQDTIKYALDKEFKVMEVIGGPKIWYDDNEDIYLLLSQTDDIKYYSRKKRPSIHFMILGNKHLFLERHHRHDQSRETLGIENANEDYLKVYKEAFELLKKESEFKKPEEVLKMGTYSDEYKCLLRHRTSGNKGKYEIYEDTEYAEIE